MELLSYQTLMALHLLGVVVGLGGAFASDALFLGSVRDGKISSREFVFLKRGGAVVWVGLLVLFLSGGGLFFLNPSYYLESPVFLMKMTAIFVLVLNGVVFHSVHIPWLSRYQDHPLSAAPDFERRRNWLLASGGLSFASWLTAFLLAASDNLSLEYVELAFLYLLFVSVALLGAYLMRKVIVPAAA